MKIRNIGLTAFFVSGVLILIGGVVLMYFYESVKAFDPSGGGGLALFILWIILGLGIVAFIGAASVWTIAALIGLFTWGFSSVYRTASPKGKSQIRWGVLILFVSCAGIVSVYSYLQSQPEAIAKRAAENKVLQAKIQADKATKQAEYKAKKAVKNAKLKKEQELRDKRYAEIEKAKAARYQLQADKSCHNLHDIMLGKYAIKEYPTHSVEYFDKGIMLYANENGWSSKGKWSLNCTMPIGKGIATVLKESVQRCQECLKTDISYYVVLEMSGPDLWLSRQDKKEYFNLTRPIN